MAKYLLSFTVHNKKKKTFGTLDFRKKWVFCISGFGISGISGISGFYTYINYIKITGDTVTIY